MSYLILISPPTSYPFLSCLIPPPVSCIQFYDFLLYPIPAYPFLLPSYPLPTCSIYPILSYPVLCYPIPYYLILSYDSSALLHISYTFLSPSRLYYLFYTIASPPTYCSPVYPLLHWPILSYPVLTRTCLHSLFPYSLLHIEIKPKTSPTMLIHKGHLPKPYRIEGLAKLANLSNW